MQQSCRRLSPCSPTNWPRIIFYTRTGSHFFKHFNIISCTGFKAFCFEHFTKASQLLYALFHFGLNAVCCTKQLVMRDNKVFCRIKYSFVNFACYIAVHNIKALNCNNFFPVKQYSVRFVCFHIGRVNFNNITFYTEISTVKHIIITGVLQ